MKGAYRTFLVVNPGSTSTKVAMFRGTSSWDLEIVAQESIDCPIPTSQQDDGVIGQLELRAAQIREFLRGAGDPHLDAIAGRGGLTHPVEAGSYGINEELKSDLRTARYGNHASNLGALIADLLAGERGVPSLIADPVGVDQFEPVARYSGWPDLPRKSRLHALNMRSVARTAARDMVGTMEDFRFVIAHLGGGISVAPMVGGRLIDVNDSMDGGPFSPQRAGTLPTTGLIELCFEGSYKDAGDAISALTRRGGLYAYLGVDDAKEVCRRIGEGDAGAEEVYRAMAYQIGKEIGAMAVVLKGEVDAILLTGGLPHPPLTDWIIELAGWIAPVKIYPGEMELLALAQAAARHVCEGEELQVYRKAETK
jgi:butyrate kinase